MAEPAEAIKVAEPAEAIKVAEPAEAIKVAEPAKRPGRPMRRSDQADLAGETVRTIRLAVS